MIIRSNFKVQSHRKRSFAGNRRVLNQLRKSHDVWVKLYKSEKITSKIGDVSAKKGT